MNVKAIFFDLGMMLVTFDWNIAIPQYAAHNEGDMERVQRFLAHHQHDAFERGELSEDGFYRLGCSEMGFRGSLPEMKHIWNGIFREIPPSVKLFRAAAEQYPLYTLSNTNPWHAEYLESRFDWMQLFVRRFYSYSLGLRKPDPRIYQIACAQAGVNPADVLFVDDRLENIEGARRAGLLTIHAPTPDLLAKGLSYMDAAGADSMNTAALKMQT